MKMRRVATIPRAPWWLTGAIVASTIAGLASLNLWSTYRVPAARLTFGGGAQFTDGYFFNNTNALTSENLAAMRDLTKYWLFSAMLNFEATRHLSLQINATNLANEKYVERGYTGHFIPGPGRSLLVGPAFKF